MRQVLIGLWVLLAATACFAQAETERSDKQAEPDLSGTWIIDKSKSYKVYADRFTLEIVQFGPEVKIIEKSVKDGRESVNEHIYYTDGRSDSATTEGNRYEKITIRWKGDTLVRESNYTTTGTKFEMVLTEEWKLSKDKKSLTRTFVNRQKISMNQTLIPRLTRKYVFTRSS